MKQGFLQKHGDDVVVVLVLAAVLVFIAAYIPPRLLLSETITTGGDTGAHYYPADYFSKVVLPQGKLVGWAPGWYGGIPLFQFYFPLLFVLMGLLSKVISLQVAFKLVTFLTIVALPCATYAALRLLNLSKRVACIGAAFTVPFLFMEKNSMWGGNIPSTLAGEFSYAFGIALALAYLGLLYQGMETGRHVRKTALLLAAVGFSHVYTLLWSIVSSLFLLVGKDFKKRFAHWFIVNALAFLVLAFWLVPLGLNLGYTSAYADEWGIGWHDAFPTILWPLLALALAGLVLGAVKRDRRVLFLAWSGAIAAVFFFFAVDIGVVDIRFIPFIQVIAVLLAAYPFTFLFKLKLRGLALVPLAVLLLTVLWVQPQINYIPQWGEWNYGGFEAKRFWEPFSEVNEFLEGNASDPRVVYEHSMRHNAAGTTRAFELLPYFSGRSTLEGLYMQSTPTSPFVFYVQSEISEQASCPFPNRPCSAFNLASGTEHLKLFNVRHFVAISEKVKGALNNNSNYKLVFEKQPYAVYELVTNENRYVVVPKYKPVFFPRADWQNRSYELFKRFADVPVVFDDAVDKEQVVVRQPLNLNCSVSSELRNEEILFTTNCVGQPHLVKASYFPRWKSENGEKIYLVSPSFMLIYPEHEQTRLYFGRTWRENLGLSLSVLGWLVLVAYNPLMRRWKRAQKPFLAWLRSWRQTQKQGEKY